MCHREGERTGQQVRNRPPLHLITYSGVKSQFRLRSWNRSTSNSSTADFWPGFEHRSPLKRGMDLQPAHGAGEDRPAARQVSVLRSSSIPVSQSSLGSPTDAATPTAFPASALQEEGVVELQRVGDSEVHGHVLRPVRSMGP